jgi:hypothetical protein
LRNLFVALFLLTAVSVLADDWPPPNPAELALKAPQVEPEADAEALLWDVRVAHEIAGGWVRTELSHYLRIKVFSKAGRDRWGTVDIPYSTNDKISDIGGRTIRPDGTIAELQKESVYERTIVKTGQGKVNAKSFALPGLEVGSIIEYRWRETIEDRITNYFRLDFQRDLPIHTVRYHVKPIQDAAFPYGMGSVSLHLKAAPFAKEKDGFFATSATRIPAFKEEKDMPPKAAVRPWMLLYYVPDSSAPPDRYWQATGKSLYQSYRDHIKVHDEMRAAAKAIGQGAESDEARLSRLFEFVVREFKNHQYESADDDSEKRPQAKASQTTIDTWRLKAGSGYEITLVFLALAGALDYEARLARVSSLDFGPFNREFTDTYFLRSFAAAVKVGGKWRFCDPASPLLPFGMVRWSEQGQVALITDSKQPELVVTPTAKPEESLTRRDGRFRVGPGGNLEGDVRLTYTGHAAWLRRYNYRRQSPAEREEAVRQSVKSRHGSAEVTQIVVEGVSGTEDVTIAYRVSIPGYAQRTGRRLFLQCSFFNRNYPPRYGDSGARRHPLAYRNAWLEKDAVTFELPAGYTPESPESPGGFPIAEIGAYDARISASEGQRTLRYERTFEFGRGGKLVFAPEAYPLMKRMFDRVQELDNHTLALRQEGP